MIFTEKLPEWTAVGTEPLADKKAAGWLPDDRPPAGYFNWQWNLAYLCLLEMRQVAQQLEDNQNMALGATVFPLPAGATDVMLDNNGQAITDNDGNVVYI